MACGKKGVACKEVRQRERGLILAGNYCVTALQAEKKEGGALTHLQEVS